MKDEIYVIDYIKILKLEKIKETLFYYIRDFSYIFIIIFLFINQCFNVKIKKAGF